MDRGEFTKAFLRAGLAVLFVVGASACVPYERYQESVAKLNIANQVNSDLERKLRDTQRFLSESGEKIRSM